MVQIFRESARGYEKQLKQVAQSRSIHGLAADDPKRVGEIAQDLLRKRLVYEYFDGDYWHDVCPQVRPTLRDEPPPASPAS